MIQLKINNQVAQLAPSTSINITENRNAFNLTSVEGTFSVPFDLPLTDVNQALFGFVNFPSSQTDFATEYDASIDFSGAIQIDGKFVLRSVETTFNGYFKTDASVLSEFSDTNIREIVTDTYTVNDPDDIAAINADLTSDFVFPKCMDLNLFEYESNSSGEGSIRFNPNTKGFLSLYKITVKLKHILNIVFRELGYSTVYDFSDQSFDKMIWIPKNIASSAIYSTNASDSQFPKTWALNEIIPNITLSQLLSSVRVNLNIKITANPVTQTITFERLIEDIVQNTPLDLSDYTVPSIKIEPIVTEEEEATSISFSVPPQQSPEDEEFLPPVRRYADAVASLAERDNIRIAEFDCIYYQCIQLELEPFGNYEYVPFTRNTVGKELTNFSEAVSYLSPIPTEDQLFRSFNALQIIDNGLGKIRIQTGTIGLFNATDVGSTQIRITSIEGNPYTRTFANITAVGIGYIDVDINYQSDIIADFQSRSAPTIEPQPFLRDAYKEGAEGGISLYHGIRNTTDNSGTYAYASASIYDTDYTSTLSNSSLIMDLNEGIYQQYYEPLINFLANSSKKGSFTSWIPLTELLKRKKSVITVKGIRYLVSKFKFRLNNRSTDRVKAEIEGRIT